MSPDHAQFFTATILKWKPLLLEAKYKNIIIESLDFLVAHKRVKIYAFVIMPNHIHLIWQILEDHKREDVQRDFLKFTSQQIQKELRNNDPRLHLQFEVNLKDRKYQIWQRNALSIDLYSPHVLEQKLDYIHNNPVQSKWMLSDDPTSYEYSSASYYEEGDERFSFLSHYMEYFGN
jgi:REP element-mobilizing transposase RayT